MANFSQQVYADFSGGFNDSVAAISIKDTEVCISENADYSAEIKSFKTRKGCEKLNKTSFKDALSAQSSVEVTDAHVWTIGSKYKKAVVIDSKLYDYDEVADSMTFKINLTPGAKLIYPFVVFNKFYFGDGSELYVWGDYDKSSEESAGGDLISFMVGEIVRNNDSTTSGSQKGHFYQCKVAQSNINLTNTNYANTTNWTDVTEVPFFASSVCRVMPSYDPSQKEIVRISVTSGCSSNGNITIYLDGTAFTVAVTPGDVNSVVGKILAGPSGGYTGWTAERSPDGYAVMFTRNSVGLSENGYVDPGTTGCTLTYLTVQEGTQDDNDLAPIKKCTMFVVHTSSYRVFAAGNPDDNAVFYSEIGNPAYFKSATNKVYSVNSYGKPTGMFQLSESILISFEDGWYAWDGVTALSDATWKPLNLPYGCVSNRTIANTPYSFMFLGRDGIYNVSASILNKELLMLQGRDVINKISRNKVDNTISSIADMSSCTAIFYENTYYLAYNTKPEYYSSKNTYEVGDYVENDGVYYMCKQTISEPENFIPSKWEVVTKFANTRVLKYEWDTTSFTEVTGWRINSWFYDNQNLHFASRNYLLKANVGTHDINCESGEPKPINLLIKTKEYHFGNPFVDKVCRLVGLIFKQPSGVNDRVNAHVKVNMGYDSYMFNTIDITESLIWGRNWGLLWGFREAIAKMAELTMRSNTFQLEITNNDLDAVVTLVAIGFVYETTDFIIPTLLKDEVLLQ